MSRPPGPSPADGSAGAGAQGGWPPPREPVDEGPPGPPAATIQGLGNRLKELFEAGRWPELAREAGLEEIWFLDGPLNVTDALDLADRTLGDQVELMLVRIQMSESEEDRARGTYTCALLWVDTDTWEQTEHEFDLHLGFSRETGGPWSLDYLGVTAATPERMFAPLESAPVAGWPDGGAPPAVPPGPSVADARLAVDASGRTVVYLPVVVSEAEARRLLEAARIPGGDGTHEGADDRAGGGADGGAEGEAGGDREEGPS